MIGSLLSTPGPSRVRSAASRSIHAVPINTRSKSNCDASRRTEPAIADLDGRKSPRTYVPMTGGCGRRSTERLD